MSSRRVVDLRKRKTIGTMRPFAFREPQAKRPSLRSRRRRSRLFIGVVAAVLIAAAGYGVSYASYLPRFTVQHIEIAGAKDVSTELVHSLVEGKLASNSFAFFSPSNIFLYPRAEIEAAVREQYPPVNSVSVSRESLFATAITVKIEERKAFARWCSETCYALDESGFIFGAASDIPNVATPYDFGGALATSTEPIGQTFLPGRFVGVVALLERLGQAGFSPERITMDGAQDFSVRLAEGYVINATFGSDVGTLVKNLELVLSSDALRGKESQLEYIDLRFGNRVYYKLRGEEQKGGDPL